MIDDLCGRCGASPGARHHWVDGDCVVGYHRAHSPATVGPCCEACVDRIGDWLSEITRLFHDLPRVIPLGSVPDDTAAHSHARRSASPAQMRLDPWSMVYDRDRLHYRGDPADVPDVPAVLADIAGRLHDDLGTAAVERGVAGCATFVTLHRADLARSGWVEDAFADLRWVRRHLRAAHGITGPESLGECMSVRDGRDCGGQVCPSTDRDPRPKCTRCNRRYSPLDLVRLRMVNG